MRLRRLEAPFVYLTVLAISIFALLASFTFGTPKLAAAESPSFVRVIHASPFVGTADVFLDGKKLLSSFAFGSVTDYASIPPGPHKVQIALVGKGPGAAAINQTLTVAPGLAYTVAAIGATSASLSLEVFVDSNLITPGTAKLRVYHLSPNAGPISVTAGGNTLVSNITYQQASKYLAIPAGSYTFNVDATQVNMTLPLSTTLATNMVRSIFAVGMFNGTPKLELVSTQVNGLPSLPSTGSDPNTPAKNSQPTAPWLPLLLVGVLAVLIISTKVIARRPVVR